MSELRKDFDRNRGKDRTMMVVPNEFFAMIPRSSLTADAGDLWRHAVMQHACIPRGLQGRGYARYEARKKNKGVGLKLGLSETSF